MRISDWSSDVVSSDLRKQEIYRADGCRLASVRACRSSYDRMSEMGAGEAASSERLRFLRYLPLRRIGQRVQHRPPGRWRLYPDRSLRREIGLASCRDRVMWFVYSLCGGLTITK